MKLDQISRKLFFLLIVLVPFQLGLHFWPEWAFSSGVRVDYFSPTLYLTDLLVLGIFVLEIFKFPKLSKNFVFIFSLVGILALFNIYASLSPAVSIYKWLKVLEMGFLVWFVARNQIDKHKIALLLLIPVLYESILVFWQFLSQSSIGGIWYALGERTFNSSTPGIANTVINGQLWLRPYGTFPHPNVLGGFLAIVLPLIIYFFPRNYRKITALVVSFGLAALFLSLSRGAIVLGLVGISVSLVLRLGFGKMWLVLGMGILATLVVFGLQTDLFSLRQEFSTAALDVFSRSPIVGAGLGTSPLFVNVSNFALQNQPTHNIYLMILGESGTLGLLGLLALITFALIKVIREKAWILVTSLVTIVLIGLFDHYFLTLQQGMLLLAIILGFSISRDKTAKITGA